ncbi:MAG: C45 family autoproteolytic acyltransferase/hydrolase [Myxococcota bacterium]
MLLPWDVMTGGRIELIELEGTPREMGRAFGEQCRMDIEGLYGVRVENAITQALNYGQRSVDEAGLHRVAARCLQKLQGWRPWILEELKGIAEGARRTTEEIWTMNALTDLRDLVAFGDGAWTRAASDEGCTALLADRSEAGGRTLVGQTWDLASDNLPFLRVVMRQPLDGAWTKSLTLVGCLTLLGVNEVGIAVGTTNIRATDNRIGVGYLDVLHAALAETSCERAVQVVETAPRAAAHFYWVADRNRVVAVECSATRCVRREVDGAYVHTNHMTESELEHLEVQGTPMASSYARHARMWELVAEASRPLEPSWLKRALADTENGELAIDRRDFAGISTNAGLVVRPGEPDMWVVHGPASRGCWFEF